MLSDEVFVSKQSLAIPVGGHWLVTIHLQVTEYDACIVTACSIALLAGLNNLQVPIAWSDPPIKMNHNIER